MLGVLFKAVNWAIGIIVLANGDSRIYFMSYLSALIIILTTNFFGYYYYGLQGLGAAFLTTHLLLTIQSYAIANHFYSYSLGTELVKIFIIQFTLSLTCFILFQITVYPINYILGISLFLVSLSYSFHELDKRLDIKTIFHKVKKRLLK